MICSFPKITLYAICRSAFWRFNFKNRIINIAIRHAEINITRDKTHVIASIHQGFGSYTLMRLRFGAALAEQIAFAAACWPRIFLHKKYYRGEKYSWQLPSYSGTKSYQNLLVDVYGGVENVPNGSIAAIIPINFTLSGAYYYDSGNHKLSEVDSTMWTRSRDYIKSGQPYEFGSTDKSFGKTHDGSWGFGFALRCLVC